MWGCALEVHQPGSLPEREVDLRGVLACRPTDCGAVGCLVSVRVVG